VASAEEVSKYVAGHLIVLSWIVRRPSNEKTAAALAGRFFHPDALAAFVERPQADRIKSALWDHYTRKGRNIRPFLLAVGSQMGGTTP
jgi:hypothetical protein